MFTFIGLFLAAAIAFVILLLKVALLAGIVPAVVWGYMFADWLGPYSFFGKMIMPWLLGLLLALFIWRGFVAEPPMVRLRLRDSVDHLRLFG